MLVSAWAFVAIPVLGLFESHGRHPWAKVSYSSAVHSGADRRKSVQNIFSKLEISATTGYHRGVLAALTFLDSD